MSGSIIRLQGRIEGVEADLDGGVSVELWLGDFPDDVLPMDLPLSELDNLPDTADEEVTATHLGTGTTNAEGSFEIAVPTARLNPGDQVFVRVFDGDEYLDSTWAQLTEREADDQPGEAAQVLFVSVTGVDLADGRRSLAIKLSVGAATVVVSALAVQRFFLSGSDDPSMTPDESRWQPEISAPYDRYAPPRRISQQAEFLYTGEDPIQTGVDEGTIDSGQVAVLRGRVTDRSGTPLEGATVTVNNRPEYGQTRTRETGLFDMAVNGGATLVVNVATEGYLPAQRKLTPQPRDYEILPEIALVPTDDNPTTVSMNAPAPQVARGSPSEDQDGRRQPLLVFPPGTVARTPSGEQPDSLTVRITEYTVGENGPEAMPLRLPPETAYTFAVEFSADEMDPSTSVDTSSPTGEETLQRAFVDQAPGSVQFNRPVVQYVENFLDFPVGEAVPTGAVDRSNGTWTAIDDGRVVEVLGTSDGRARLDTDGSGTRTSRSRRREMGISDAEREAVAQTYEAGTQLWRVPIPHFTPFDCNWPREFPDDAEAPPIPRSWIEEPECPDPRTGVGGSVSGSNSMTGPDRATGGSSKRWTGGSRSVQRGGDGNG